ncbi:E3 binding domain-containing protein [Marinobacter sp. JSM 1782161]|uniref:E3 binding domain-containing protein n=1 Tax=Marinobacter sp. JSM 1782161 TaxID=2685906 RepID=UPI001401F5E6|nr:E3 binding domain-containing protein [Marinobacter sp. JSM 1782161]
MKNIRLRYLAKAGPSKAGREFLANHVETKALVAIGHAEVIEDPTGRYLTREIAPAQTKQQAPIQPPEPLASDAVKELAAKHEVDLNTITGTGKNGRIVKADIEALIKPEPSE